jgi:hypothetical protein
MVTVTKKQASILAAMAVIAAVMFAGPVALNLGINSAFAAHHHHVTVIVIHHHHHHHHHHHVTVIVIHHHHHH